MRPLDITFHFDAPSLRVMLADVFFFALNLFVATAWAAMIMAVIAIPIAILVAIGMFIKQFISFCSL